MSTSQKSFKSQQEKPIRISKDVLIMLFAYKTAFNLRTYSNAIKHAIEKAERQKLLEDEPDERSS